ncbi:helix-turn-helix domain-containing protein [Loktanella sp. S4079]|uniref:helix-turn-helix domain-containing protein n=1 Tax=Loktanella sp. S4079 TaxID=579483 RepID=UPI0005FA2945|nr:XRE family transcriptional regulator [Loktanella sp. S4079]KJZ18922.1 XRE family transcriptional regulator [Loktanella sp. S4079]
MSQFEKSAQTLGADIRALRKARGMTLVELAESLNRSVGWLSQVERDISVPAISDLGELASVLDVAVSSLLQTGVSPSDEGIVVRSNARRPIGSRTPGLTEGLLSPDLTDDFEVIHSKFDPGSELITPLVRKTQEIGYVITGIFEIWVDGKHFKLNTGDSFRLRGETFRWCNPGTKPCEIIWIISPPIY